MMNDEIVLGASASGLPIPVVKRSFHEYPLHSRYDPVKEARKLFEASAGCGYVVFYGLGFGYHVTPFIESKNVSRILILETDPGMVNRVKALHDFSGLLSDPRVTLAGGMTREEILNHILSTYVPMIHGPLSVVQLRSRSDLDREYFSACTEAVTAALTSVRADVSVQSHFARNWHSNGLRNLPAAGRKPVGPGTADRVVITAAGPSLENHRDELSSLDAGTVIVATDTSYPYLKACGIRPDYVVSIDCQQISYRHFMGGTAVGTRVVIDLFSSPTVARLFRDPVFFLSAHPFSALIRSGFPMLPVLDTGGGNVTQTALSFAVFLGARNVTILGADYSYPGGKSYARDTYIYDMFRNRETRIDPLELQFYSFLFRSGDAVRESRDDIFTTGVLNAYRSSLFAFMEKNGMKYDRPAKPGDPIRVELDNAAGNRTVLEESAGASDPFSFLHGYLLGLRNLPRPYDPLASYLQSVSREERPLVLSVLPVAYYFSARKCGSAAPSATLMEAITWCIAYLTDYFTGSGNTIPAYPTNESDT